MNKKIQGIIVGGVIVAALGGTLAFLELTGNDPKDAPTEDSSVAVKVDPESDPVPIISTEPGNIKEVIVENEQGGFDLERPSSGKSELNIKELVGINQNGTVKAGLVNALAELEAYKLVEENASDLAKYGLTEPKTSFTVVFGDGTEKKYLIGDDDVNKKRYCYFSEDGKKDVYMVLKAKIAEVFYSKEEFVSTALTPSELCNSGTYGKLVVKRKDLDYDMVFEQPHKDKPSLVAAQVMSAPIYASLNVTESTKVTHGLSALDAQSCVMINPKEEDFKTYGLDDPAAEVIYEEENITCTLKIGSPIYKKNTTGSDTAEIEAYYCYITGYPGEDCIWTISAEKAIWASFMPGDIIAMMTANTIYEISEVKITAENLSYDFTLSADGDKEIYWVRKNGELMEDDGPFRSIYLFTLSFPTKEIYFDEIEGDPFLKIEIIRSDTGGDTLEFFKETDRRVLVKVNGRPSFRIASKWTDEYIKNFERLEKGETLLDKPSGE